ncbi:MULTISPECIES: FKBP-type peptidyl-prolyl cis-trans isomerase [unclassified Acinetobacter]|uniref:FKBP-type peptidyl-prolyl cis-trans isomerase n=1 Tax=unclassified Acinetobacter TaxID=196816 RepID=UPI0035B946A6
MSKALPIAVAAVLGGVALVPVYLASQNPSQFQTKPALNVNFDTKNANAAQKISYVLGYEIANQSPEEIDLDAFSAGAKAGHAHEQFPFTQEEIQAAHQEFMKQIQQNQVAKQATNAKPAPASAATKATDEGAAFLAENAKKPDVKTTASGLQYIVKKPGTGKQPTANSTVKVHYQGTLINGQVFDSSLERGEPIEFPLKGVIPGWTEGLQLMKEGGEFTFFIPAKLAYGERDMGSIPPNSTLIFDVQLIQVK